MKLQNREGQAVPSVVFRTRRDHEWVDVTSDEVFKDKTVVVFAGEHREVVVHRVGHHPGGQDDQVGRLRCRLQIGGDLRRDSQGLCLSSGRGSVAIANDCNAGHPLTHSQRDRATQEPQPYDGNLT